MEPEDQLLSGPVSKPAGGTVFSRIFVCCKKGKEGGGGEEEEGKQGT